MNYTHKLPQEYPVEERMRLIKHYLDSGYDYRQIGQMFGGVLPITIKYHWERYGLGKPYGSKQKKRSMINLSGLSIVSPPYQPPCELERRTRDGWLGRRRGGNTSRSASTEKPKRNRNPQAGSNPARSNF